MRLILPWFKNWKLHWYHWKLRRRISSYKLWWCRVRPMYLMKKVPEKFDIVMKLDHIVSFPLLLICWLKGKKGHEIQFGIQDWTMELKKLVKSKMAKHWGNFWEDLMTSDGKKKEKMKESCWPSKVEGVILYPQWGFSSWKLGKREIALVSRKPSPFPKLSSTKPGSWKCLNSKRGSLLK